MCTQHVSTPHPQKSKQENKTCIRQQQIEAVQSVLCYLKHLLHGELLISCQCFSVPVGFCIVCLMAITQPSAAGVGMRWVPNNVSGFPHHWAPVQFGQRELCCSDCPDDLIYYAGGFSFGSDGDKIEPGRNNEFNTRVKIPLLTLKALSVVRRWLRGAFFVDRACIMGKD